MNALPDKVLSETTDPHAVSFSSNEKTIPYGSQVLLKSDIMKTILAYVMNVTQMDGRNLNHVRTRGQTSIFVRNYEILSVEKEGDPNMFQY